VLEIPEVIPSVPEMDIELIDVKPFFEVAHLTPNNNAVLWSSDPTNNKETWIIPVGNGDVIVTATPNPNETDESKLPDCWTFTGGTAIGVGKLQRKTDTLTPKVVTFTASVACSTKTVELIVYRAAFTLKSDQGNQWAIEVGHAWWELDLQPQAARNLLHPILERPYIDEAGYWPDFEWVVIVQQGPGEVIFGDQSHPVTGYYTWTTTLDHLQAMLSYVKSLSQNPGTYHLYNHNCVHEAVQIGNLHLNLGIPATIDTPWELSDYLNGLW
jgi:hypothetical protein